MTLMTHNQFPPGWNEERVRRVIAHYENQTKQQAIAEDDAAFNIVVEVPDGCSNQQSAFSNPQSSEA